MTDSDRLLTVSEAAERLRLNPETIRRWLRDGRLDGVWLGSDKAGWRISERDLDTFIHNRRTRKESSDA
jgi:excisionase family DNA binding protein